MDLQTNSDVSSVRRRCQTIDRNMRVHLETVEAHMHGDIYILTVMMHTVIQTYLHFDTHTHIHTHTLWHTDSEERMEVCLGFVLWGPPLKSQKQLNGSLLYCICSN